MGYRVAVVGATGAVGREMLKTLAERQFPVDEVAAVASGRSTGQEVSFGEKRVLKVQNLEKFDFAGWDIGLFSPGASVSAIHAPRAAAAGCVVIDNTSQFRMDADVPLVVPEVNPEALRNYGKRNIIANPNCYCSTIQMVVAPMSCTTSSASSAWWSRPTSRCPALARKGWTSCSTTPSPRSSTNPRRRSRSPRTSPSTASRTSTSSSTTARPRRNGRWWSRPRKILDLNIAVFATGVRVPGFLIGHG